jgi:AcrR family transcriptional regulator
MRESKAKKKILQMADEMLKRVGYADLNVNEIAHEARVSIGTLYYHFPEGKISILMEIRRRIAGEYKTRLSERLNTERIGEAASFNEGLGSASTVRRGSSWPRWIARCSPTLPSTTRLLNPSMSRV